MQTVTRRVTQSVTHLWLLSGQSSSKLRDGVTDLVLAAANFDVG